MTTTITIDSGTFTVHDPAEGADGWCLVTTDAQPTPLGLVRLENDLDGFGTRIPNTDVFGGWDGAEPRGQTLAKVCAEWRTLTKAGFSG